MALNANTTWEVRQDGNDLNGGAFVTGIAGTDWTLQAAAHVTIDGATITATVHSVTSQLNIVGYTVAAGDIGNILRISGGTATAGLYQITVADTVNNRWTLDRTAGTAAQTATGRMGGALASIGQLGADVNSANVVNVHAYIREGTYTLTSASANVSGGTYANTTNITCFIIGYSASGGRNSWAATPVIDCGAITGVTVFSILNGASSGPAIANVLVDGKSNANIIGIALASSGAATAIRCTANNCTTGFSINSASNRAVSCKASNCTTGFTGSSNSIFIRCWADGCPTGFTISNNNATYVSCLATDCTVPFTSDANNTGRLYVGCTADDAGGTGFVLGGTLGGTLIDCVATNTAGGFGATLTGNNTLAVNFATFNNPSGAVSVTAAQTRQLGAIVLGTDPWVNAAGDDYRPNGTSGAGSSLRGVALGILGQTDSKDIGAVQHQDLVNFGALG